MRQRSMPMYESSHHLFDTAVHFDPIELLASRIPFVDPFNCDFEDLGKAECQPNEALELSESSGYADQESSNFTSISVLPPSPVVKERQDDELNEACQSARSPVTSTRRTSLSQVSGSKFHPTCSDSSLEMFRRTSSDSSLDTRSSSPGNMFEVAELSEGFSRTMSLPTPGPSTFHDAHPKAVGSSAKNRFKLTSEQAIHIFTHKINKTARTASLLSVKYGISPKAIRDIWTLKSWAQETRPFWTRLDEQQSTTPAPARFTNRRG